MNVNMIFVWLGGLVALLGLIVWLGHRPGPKWPVVVLAIVFSLTASAAIGSVGLGGFVEGVCNYTGFCPP